MLCVLRVSYIPPPDAKGRESIFSVYKKKYGLEGDVLRWSELSDGFSGADIENVCRESVYMCLREESGGMRESGGVRENGGVRESERVRESDGVRESGGVREEVVLRALKTVKPSLKKEDLCKYVAFRDAFYSV